MVVLITCKNEEDPMKNKGARVARVQSAHLYPGLPMGFTRVNLGRALSHILQKWVLSGSSVF